MNQLARLAPALSLPALIASADDRAQRRFLEFFAVTIRNPHTRRPAHIVRRGKTSVLAPDGARRPLDVTTPVGLRDQALIALMVYSFARIGAALGMPVEYVEKGLLCTS